MLAFFFFFYKIFLPVLASSLSSYTILNYLLCVHCATMLFPQPSFWSLMDETSQCCGPSTSDAVSKTDTKANEEHPNSPRASFVNVSIHWVLRFILSSHTPGYLVVLSEKNNQWQTSNFLLNLPYALLSSLHVLPWLCWSIFSLSQVIHLPALTQDCEWKQWIQLHLCSSGDNIDESPSSWYSENGATARQHHHHNIFLPSHLCTWTRYSNCFLFHGNQKKITQAINKTIYKAVRQIKSSPSTRM